MSAGIVLVVAGVWVLAQVFGGDALGRLGIAGQPTTPGKPPPSGLGPGGGAGGGAGGGGGGAF